MLGASGGVGLAAVDIAKAKGARVVAGVSTEEKAKICRDYGVDDVVIYGGAVSPSSANGAALGSASKEWSDIFVADGAVINLGDDQDVTLTHVH